MMSSESKRKRGENFSNVEREEILNFVQLNSAIIETKSNDYRIFQKRSQLWEQLATKLKALGYPRTRKEIKAAYLRMKQQAKKVICRYPS